MPGSAVSDNVQRHQASWNYLPCIYKLAIASNYKTHVGTNKHPQLSLTRRELCRDLKLVQTCCIAFILRTGRPNGSRSIHPAPASIPLHHGGKLAAAHPCGSLNRHSSPAMPSHAFPRPLWHSPFAPAHCRHPILPPPSLLVKSRSRSSPAWYMYPLRRTDSHAPPHESLSSHELPIL